MGFVICGRTPVDFGMYVPREEPPTTDYRCHFEDGRRQNDNVTQTFTACVLQPARHYSMHTTWHGIDSCSRPSPSSSPDLLSVFFLRAVWSPGIKSLSLEVLFGRDSEVRSPGSSRRRWFCLSLVVPLAVLAAGRGYLGRSSRKQNISCSSQSSP